MFRNQSRAGRAAAPVIQAPIEAPQWNNSDFASNGEFFLINTYAPLWKTCFDIGANTGEYSQEVAQINPSCRIFSFEPNPDLAPLIKERGISEIHSMAVGEKTGEIMINLNQADHTQSSVYRTNENTQEVKVPQVSLDDFAKQENIRFIDFIKIDTEGHELSVIKGARKLCSDQRVGMIQFEYGGTYKDADVKLKDMYELLRPNYLIANLTPTGLVPLPYSSKLETYLYSNWVAVARSLHG